LNRPTARPQTLDIFTDGPCLVLTGRFDGRSTWRVRAALYDLLADVDDVVVDLTGVDAVDVTALKVLAAASFAGARDGQHITLRGCNGPVRRLLHRTHLIRLLEVERCAASA